MTDATPAFPRPPAYQNASLAGKVAIVTGASSGFGVQFAWRLAELGVKLVLVARRAERLAAFKDALTAEFPGLSVHTVTLDVRDIPACEAFVDQLPPEFAQVDILINNAGLALGTATAADSVMDNMRQMLETNVLGVMALTKSCLKGMQERNTGHIVNISSTAAHETYAGGSGYNASKFALRAYTDAMRHELVATNIRVSMISPGGVETEFSLVRFSGDASKAAKVYEGMARLTSADIADHLVYILTRPPQVQIADLITTSTHQSGARTIARPLAT